MQIPRIGRSISAFLRKNRVVRELRVQERKIRMLGDFAVAIKFRLAGAMAHLAGYLTPSHCAILYGSVQFFIQEADEAKSKHL